MILWAAGVSAWPLGRKLGRQRDGAGRVLVNPDLSVPAHSDVFVIGDLAALKDASGRLLPAVVPVALLEGGFVAKLIRRELAQDSARARGEGGQSAWTSRPAFHRRDKGSRATMGRAAAIAQFGKIHIPGYVAWLAQLVVYIVFLIGFLNWALVLIQ